MGLIQSPLYPSILLQLAANTVCTAYKIKLQVSQLTIKSLKLPHMHVHRLSPSVHTYSCQLSLIDLSKILQPPLLVVPPEVLLLLRRRRTLPLFVVSRPGSPERADGAEAVEVVGDGDEAKGGLSDGQHLGQLVQGLLPQPVCLQQQEPERNVNSFGNLFM